MNLSPLMLEKLEVIKEHKIVEYEKHDWYDSTKKCLSKIGRWSYPDVKTSLGFRDTIELEWEIDGKTVKALARRGLIEPIEFASGFRGEYPIKYRIPVVSTEKHLN